MPTNDEKKPASPPKKTYRRPRILSRDRIEGRANVCDPTAAGKASKPLCNVLKS